MHTQKHIMEYLNHDIPKNKVTFEKKGTHDMIS